MTFTTYNAGDDQLLVTTDDAGKSTATRNTFVFMGFSNGISPYHRKQYNWIASILASKDIVLNIVEVPTTSDMSTDKDAGELTAKTIILPPTLRHSIDGFTYALLQDVEMGRGWAALLKIRKKEIVIIAQGHRDTVRENLLAGDFIRSFGIDYTEENVESLDVVEKKISLGYFNPKHSAYLEEKINEFDTLQKIVDQLASCRYEAEGGFLINNVAFLALKRMAEKAVILIGILLCTNFCMAQIDSSQIHSFSSSWSIGYSDSVCSAGTGSGGRIVISTKNGDTLSVVRMLLNKLKIQQQTEIDLWSTVGAGVNFLNEIPDYWREKNNKAWPAYLKQLKKMGFYSGKRKE